MSFVNCTALLSNCGYNTVHFLVTFRSPCQFFWTQLPLYSISWNTPRVRVPPSTLIHLWDLDMSISFRHSVSIGGWRVSISILPCSAGSDDGLGLYHVKALSPRRRRVVMRLPHAPSDTRILCTVYTPFSAFPPNPPPDELPRVFFYPVFSRAH